MSTRYFYQSVLPMRGFFHHKYGILGHKQCVRTFFNIFKNWKKEEVKFDSSTLPYSFVVPAKVGPKRTIPDHISRPEYADRVNGRPRDAPIYPVLADESDVKRMRESCAMARKILDIAREEARIGVTTDEIDEVVTQACIENHCYPSPLQYKGFPKSVCTSVNNIAVHGIPDSRPLQNGDIITIDVTVLLEGYHGDCSETYPIGEVDDRARKLIDVARLCRDKAIATCRHLEFISCIGNIVESTAKSHGFINEPAFTGHGIGPFFHCRPYIWHYANRYVECMHEGMIFTIEPVILEFKDRLHCLEDNWTVTSKRGARSAQFEHTILVTNEGCEILTAGKDEPSVVMKICEEIPSDKLVQNDDTSQDRDEWKFR